MTNDIVHQKVCFTVETNESRNAFVCMYGDNEYIWMQYIILN